MNKCAFLFVCFALIDWFGFVILLCGIGMNWFVLFCFLGGVFFLCVFGFCVWGVLSLLFFLYLYYFCFLGSCPVSHFSLKIKYTSLNDLTVF